MREQFVRVRSPSVYRVQCTVCGKRIWGSGLGIGSHKKEMRMSREVKIVAIEVDGAIRKNERAKVYEVPVSYYGTRWRRSSRSATPSTSRPVSSSAQVEVHDRSEIMTMMACGHAANATRDGKPACVICWEINPGAAEVVESPDLTGRKARCADCGREQPSAFNLPFFEYRGPGSARAQTQCAGCGYSVVAHRAEVQARNQRVCRDFKPAGPHEFDLMYDGCRGWD